MNNIHEIDTFTKERLDREVANPSWNNVYNSIIVKILVAICLDHKPILASRKRKRYGKEKRGETFQV